jgi:hypothetical protein
VLSFPAQIDREGMYVFDSVLQPAPCEACGVSIELAVDDTSVASAITDSSGSLPALGNSTAVRLQPGSHQFSIQVSGKNVCGGKGFGVTIAEYAVRQVIRPFDTGTGAADND